MATLEQMEKKRSRQVLEILSAVKTLGTEVAELKADIGRTDEILAAANYLKAAFMEIATVKGEILEANDLPFEVLKTEIYGLKQQVAELSGQIAELKAEIAGLKFTTVTSPPPTSRRTKK